MEYSNVKHRLKPFYNYTEVEAKEYDYFNGFMYLMDSRRGRILAELGLPVYALSNKNGVQVRMRCANDFKGWNYACGIEKSAWQQFLHTEKGAAFVIAWNRVSEVAQIVRHQLGIHRDGFIEDYYDLLYCEENRETRGYFDERKEYLGDMANEQKSVKRHIRLYLALMSEYAEMLCQESKESGTETVDKEYVFNEILVEYTRLNL